MRFKAPISLSLATLALFGLTVPPLLAEKEMTKKEKRQAEREAERQRQEEADAEKKRQDKIDAKAKAEREAKQKAEDEKVAQKKAEEERIAREKRTIDVMIRMFCRDHHDDPAAACGECSELRDYAFDRIDKCPFHFHKPTCVNCPIHCYRSEMRDRVRTVMRYAGPRMLTRHPWLAVMHLIDGRREVEWPPRADRNRKEGVE